MTLTDLVAPDRWQRLQDHFAEVLSIGLRTCDAQRRLLTTPSWPPGLDAQRLAGLVRLGEELDELLPAGNPSPETITILRPLGISFSVCPLKAAPDRTVAYFVVGPVMLGRREAAEQVRERALAAGVDPNAVWPLILTVKLYSFGTMRSVLRLLEEVGTSLLESGYEAYRVKTGGAGAPPDQAVASHLARIARSLLDAAVAATGAEGGAVLLYDPSGPGLRISVAQGLPDLVVQRTLLRLGEGLSGVAMSQRRTLLLSDHTTDERLRSLMTREELASSLVAPLVPDGAEDPIGALTLRTTNAHRRFTLEHVQMLDRLLALAGLAMGRVRPAFGSPS